MPYASWLCNVWQNKEKINDILCLGHTVNMMVSSQKCVDLDLWILFKPQGFPVNKYTQPASVSIVDSFVVSVWINKDYELAKPFIV